MWNLVRSPVGQDFGERDDARPAHIGRVVAIEIALDLVEGIRCEQLDEIRRNVAQDRLPRPERTRRKPMTALNLLLDGLRRQRAAQAASSCG
jgi:hypothetical protein